MLYQNEINRICIVQYKIKFSHEVVHARYVSQQVHVIIGSLELFYGIKNENSM